MKRIKYCLFSVFTTLALYSQNVASSSIDTQREEIIHYSRLGEKELKEGTKQLQDLYQKTLDKKVRDDLITLLVRQNHNIEALSLCVDCTIKQYSENELEHLAKAARNERQFKQALLFYTQLNKISPKNPNGLLGVVLVNTDLTDFKTAKKYLSQYKKRFGEDKSFIEARNYLLDSSESSIMRLKRWQNELANNPTNTDLVKKLYQLSKDLKLLPLQEELLNSYPNVFTRNDRLWWLHDEAIRQYRTAITREQQENAYSMLLNVNHKASDDLLKTQTLYDIVVIASKLDNPTGVENAYSRLRILEKPIPSYVKEAYADHLLASGSPFSALSLYREVENEYIQQKHKVPFALGGKIVNAMSDAAQFGQAQEYLEHHITEPTVHVLDFTRSRKIINPLFDEYFFSKVNLLRWRGDISTAIQLIDKRLDRTPGDAWVMLRKAELESARERHDDALAWYDKAQIILGQNVKWANVTRISLALQMNDIKSASKSINQLSEHEKKLARYVVEQYEQVKAARLVASGGISHRTFPVRNTNEVKQEYRLYSPKTDSGHTAYIHYSSSRTPDEQQKFALSRIGLGIDSNFYPITIMTEAGSLRGKKITNKPYLYINAFYYLNQYLNMSLYGNINGENTPVKAIYQKIYTKDIGAIITYIYSSLFKVTTNLNVMKFSDGNIRNNFSLLTNINLFKYDRWNLDSSLYWSYQRNKYISSAHYYNPIRNQFIEGALDLSYLQPFDYKIILVHHLKSSVGRYWQEQHKSYQTWFVAYGQEWRFNKKWSLFYELGRKKSVYDGSAEFDNFMNANLEISF